MEEKKDSKEYAKKVTKELSEQVKAKVSAQSEAQSNRVNQAAQTRMSYEQLNNIAHQLSEQNLQLRRQLQMMDMSNYFKRLDYLFKVVQFEHVFDEHFVDDCIIEIEDSIKIAKDSEDNTEDNKEDNTEGEKYTSGENQVNTQGREGPTEEDVE